MRPTFKQRTRIFVAVEGESEQSFITWLQHLALREQLAVHLDTVVLHGGGYESMLHRAVTEAKRRAGKSRPHKHSLLLVDEDRSHQGDWSIEMLKKEAGKRQMQVCVQRPNYEGLLYRMVNGHENDFVSAATAQARLRACWRTYEKPVNAQKLAQRYSLHDLLRTAEFDEDLCLLLGPIGLLR